MFKKLSEKKDKEKETAPVSLTPEPESEKVVQTKEEDSFAISAQRSEDARAGRNISDIPIDDVYWEIANQHTLAHGKHAVRVDALDTVKGKPVTRDEE
jgi:hypothetical protein